MSKDDIIAILLGWAITLAGLFLAGHAHATDMSFCALWAREATRIAITNSNDPDVLTADVERLSWRLRRAYAICLNTEADVIDLPNHPDSSDEAWVLVMRQLLIDKQGTEPATDAPIAQLGDKAVTFDPDWVARCKRDYRTFREEDGTVIRRGSKGKRTLCPL